MFQLDFATMKLVALILIVAYAISECGRHLPKICRCLRRDLAKRPRTPEEFWHTLAVAFAIVISLGPPGYYGIQLYQAVVYQPLA